MDDSTVLRAAKNRMGPTTLRFCRELESGCNIEASPRLKVRTIIAEELSEAFVALVLCELVFFVVGYYVVAPFSDSPGETFMWWLFLLPTYVPVGFVVGYAMWTIIRRLYAGNGPPSVASAALGGLVTGLMLLVFERVLLTVVL
jgi:hypothetical protein